MENKVYRLEYRGTLKEEYEEEEIKEVLKGSIARISGYICEGKIITAALYHYKKMLFFYYEAVGKEMHPEEFLKELIPFLEVWPGQDGLETCEGRRWVYMYPIFYHDIPQNRKKWQRPSLPQKRVGRIAFLNRDKIFSYVYYHKKIVDEARWQGDRYSYISLHENILFSYFEEPRTNINLSGDLTLESEVIKEWMAVSPKSHFIQMPEGKGENFMIIPAYFTLGQEEKNLK